MLKDKPKVLIIEDDKLLGASLKDFLESKGFSVTWLVSGKYLSSYSIDNFDIVVLDLILPDIPGEKILEELKSRNPEIPILILTAKGDIENKEECFSKGADDYLTKPFDVLELFWRLKAILRRFPSSEIYKLGDVIVDISSGLIRKGEKELSLSKRAWDLLVYLIQNRGRILSKQEILSHVWKDVVVTEDSIRAYIKELRQILPKGAIKTFKGRGYLLK